VAGGLEDIRDVGVLWGVGAELVVGAVAEIGPVYQRHYYSEREMDYWSRKIGLRVYGNK
jgi:hypothetical protein